MRKGAVSEISHLWFPLLLQDLEGLNAGSGAQPVMDREPATHLTIMAKRACYRFYGTLYLPSTATAARYEDHQPHFLESCFLCKKPLADNRDIFMYRGDTPCCSEECRQEQIDMDEGNERKWNLSSSMKALRKKEQKRSATSASPSNAKNYTSRAGTVAAA